MAMEPSILKSVKKILGLGEDYTAFDLDVLIHINSVFSTLNQLGVGPDDGFMIEDDSVNWDTFLGTDKSLNSVKTYMFLKVKLLFDPPPTSFAIAAMQEQVKELEFRLNVAADKGALLELDDGTFVYELEQNDSFPDDAAEGDVGFDPVTGDVWRNR